MGTNKCASQKGMGAYGEQRQIYNAREAKRHEMQNPDHAFGSTF